MKDLVAALIGALFAVGLGLSGMTDATKVIGFLDLAIFARQIHLQLVDGTLVPVPQLC